MSGDMMQAVMAEPFASKTPLGHLVLLVFEAVLEVVCVSLPGYIVAQQGMFDAEMQKFVANLNVALFTPCLSTYGTIIRGPDSAVPRRRRGIQTDRSRSLYEIGIAIDVR